MLFLQMNSKIFTPRPSLIGYEKHFHEYSISRNTNITQLQFNPLTELSPSPIPPQNSSYISTVSKAGTELPSFISASVPTGWRRHGNTQPCLARCARHYLLSSWQSQTDITCEGHRTCSGLTTSQDQHWPFSTKIRVRKPSKLNSYSSHK